MSYKWPGIPNGDYSFDHGRAVWNKIINYLRRLSEKLDVDIVDATADRRGMMTAADKAALDAIPDTYVKKTGDTVTGNINSTYGVNGVETVSQFSGEMAGDDLWAIRTGVTGRPDPEGAATGDNGYLEIATADNGTEPIYISQYIGDHILPDSQGERFYQLHRSATLLDEQGNTVFPGTVTAASFNGNATSATHANYATNAGTAAKLGTSDVGSATQPIYLEGGVATACTYQLHKTVPADAVFTDTIYAHPVTSGNKHIPSGGSSGQILRWSADGTAEWGADNNTTYSDATQSAHGLMSATDKKKLDGIATGAEVNQNAFSNVKVGTTTVAADAKTDTLELAAGTGITLTPDATNDKITIAVTSNTYAAASHTHSYLPLSGGTLTGALTFANGTWNTVGDDVKIGDFNKAGLLGVMGANGTTGIAFCKRDDASNYKSITYDGTNLSIGGYTLLKSVPADAKFTDTITTVSTSGSGNAVTSVTASNGALTVKKDSTFLLSNGNAVSASKLATARTISAGDLEYQGSATFDGSADIKLNIAPYSSIVYVNNRNNYPYHHIGTTGVITGGYSDYVVTFLVGRDYINGGFGICRIEGRVSNVSNNEVASCSVKWLVRDPSIPVDCVQVGIRNTPGDTIFDIYYKSPATYASAIFRVLGMGLRNSISRRFTLNNSTEVNNTTESDPLTSTYSYKTMADGAAALHPTKPYTNVITAVDCTDSVIAQSIDTNVAGGHSSYIKFNSGLVFIWGAENFTTTTGTYIDVLKKIPCTTISAFATDSEAGSSTAAASSLHQIAWARADSTNTTERFVTNTANTGYFNYLIIGKA